MSLVSQLPASARRESVEDFLPRVSPGADVVAGAAEIVALSCSYRHSFLNELQVVLGWAQMGNVERLLAFVDDLRASYHAENDLCRWADQETAALFLLRKAVAEQLSVEVQFRVDAKAPFRVPARDRALVAGLIDAVIAWIPGNAVPEPLIVSIGYDGSCLCVTCLLPKGYLPSLSEVAEALRRLRSGGLGLEEGIALFQEEGGEFAEVRAGSRCGFRLRWPADAEACS